MEGFYDEKIAYINYKIFNYLFILQSYNLTNPCID